MHVDFDYFYAQCEEIRSPELKAKPVCVCIFSDRGGDSGAIATANYNARRYGVKAGMPIIFAKKKLKDANAVFLKSDFDYYTEISNNAMTIIENKADVFEYVGRDEAYIDVTQKTGEDFEKATHLAQQIKNKIREDVKITCSIGISPNKLVSKIASDYKKPDGLTVVRPTEVEEFLEPLKIRDIPGIGGKTEKKFQNMEIDTVGKLRSLDVFNLHKLLGRKGGTFIYNAARGIDHEPVKEREATVQYSKISTLKENTIDYKFLSHNLEKICKELHEVVKRKNQMFKTITIQFVLQDLSIKTKSKTLRNPTLNIEELLRTADHLLKDSLAGQETPVRRLGVRVSELTDLKGQSTITSYF